MAEVLCSLSAALYISENFWFLLYVLGKGSYIWNPAHAATEQVCTPKLESLSPQPRYFFQWSFSATFRQIWFQKLSNIARSLPCTQLISRFSAPCASRCSSPVQPIEHLRAGEFVWSRVQVLDTWDKFFRRADRDHVFRVAETRRGLIHSCSSMGITWYEASSIDWTTVSRASKICCGEMARGNGWRNVLRDGMILCRATFEIRARFCGYWWVFQFFSQHKMVYLRPVNECPQMTTQWPTDVFALEQIRWWRNCRSSVNIGQSLRWSWSKTYGVFA